jgi:hypothetical protein
MKRKEYTEEKEGAKERFDRAMKTIFQAPKKGVEAEKEQKDAPSQRDDESADDGE